MLVIEECQVPSAGCQDFQLLMLLILIFLVNSAGMDNASKIF